MTKHFLTMTSKFPLRNDPDAEHAPLSVRLHTWPIHGYRRDPQDRYQSQGSEAGESLLSLIIKLVMWPYGNFVSNHQIINRLKLSVKLQSQTRNYSYQDRMCPLNLGTLIKNSWIVSFAGAQIWWVVLTALLLLLLISKINTQYTTLYTHYFRLP